MILGRNNRTSGSRVIAGSVEGTLLVGMAGYLVPGAKVSKSSMQTNERGKARQTAGLKASGSNSEACHCAGFLQHIAPCKMSGAGWAGVSLRMR